jgi:hypothetical protein
LRTGVAETPRPNHLQRPRVSRTAVRGFIILEKDDDWTLLPL